MRRLVPLSLVVALLALFFVACAGKEEVKKPDPRKAQMAKVRASLDDLKAEEALLKEKVSDLKTQIRMNQENLQQAMVSLESSLTAASDKSASIQGALQLMERVDRPAVDRKQNDEAGWPWPIKLLLLAALVVVVFLVIRMVTRDDDLEDADLLDDEFLEENELGTVRYPGGAGPSPGAAPASEEPRDETPE